MKIKVKNWNRYNIIHMNANFINVLSLALNVSKSINKDTKIISSGVAYMYPCDFEYI